MTPGLALVAVIVLALVAAGAAVAREQRARGCETSAPAELRPLNVDALLWAIRQVESGDNPRAIGAHGERSAYQFTEATWRRLTGLSFRIASTQPAIAHHVAQRNFTRIVRALHDRRIDLSPEAIAAAWNRGPGFELGALHSDYAHRVSALYHARIEGKAGR